MNILKENGVNITIYEPTMQANTFNGFKVINDFDSFSTNSDIILANRLDNNLVKVRSKAYTRYICERLIYSNNT